MISQQEFIALRLKLKLSVEEMAAQLGYSNVSSIYRIENGQARVTRRLEQLIRLKWPKEARAVTVRKQTV